MPMQLTVTGADGQELAVQIHNFVVALQNPSAFIPGTTSKPAAEAPKAETKEKPAKKAAAAPKETAKEESAVTLQQCIDRAREIAGDGKDEKVMTALKAINTALGISKVREMPVEKLGQYMEELDKAFPKSEEAAGGMFD